MATYAKKSTVTVSAKPSVSYKRILEDGDIATVKVLGSPKDRSKKALAQHMALPEAIVNETVKVSDGLLPSGKEDFITYSYPELNQKSREGRAAEMCEDYSKAKPSKTEERAAGPLPTGFATVNGNGQHA